MQLNQFNGGLSVRLDASLIAPNEAVRYTNIDNTDSTLSSSRNFSKTNQEARDYFYKFKDRWLSSYVSRDYLEYDNVLYFTETDNKPQKSSDGITTYNLGIVAPLESPIFEIDGVTPIVDGDGKQIVGPRATADDPEGDEDPISASNITVQYCYTYFNDADGTESAPSPLGNELALVAGKVVVLDNIKPSNDVQVTHIRIYRLQAGLGTEFQLALQVPNNVTTVRDAVGSTDLTSILDSEENQPPPLGLRYLVEAYGVLFGAVGNQLYFSKMGKSNYWPATQSFRFKGEITGLLPVQNGIFVFILSQTFMLVGSTIADFEVVPVSTEYGCNSHKSCKLVKNTPVWSCLDGIASWSNGYIQIMSKDKLGKFTLQIKDTAVWDETYFVLDTDGNLLAMDLRFNLAFKRYDFIEKLVDVGAFDGVLYGIAKERVVTLFSGEDMEFSWRSALLTEGSITIHKMYNNVYIYFQGEFTVKVYIDGDLVQEKKLLSHEKPKFEDLKVPQERQRGYSMQFDVRGVGKIWEIEYKVVGRENGR